MPAPLLYLAAFLLAGGESALFADLIVPGEAGMVVVGAAGHDRELVLPLLIALAAVGGTAGDCISYSIGRRFGREMVHKWRFTRRHLEPKFDKADDYFERHGGRAVFVARWVGALRALVPAVAGSAKMSFGSFLVWDILGSLGWAATTVSLGWFFGATLARAVDRFGLVISVVVVAGLAGWWWWRRRRKQRSGDAPADRESSQGSH